VFSASGSWEYAKQDLYNKSSKAFYKLRKMLGDSAEPSTALHIFDHTIKPILLYSSEIWGSFNTKRKPNTQNRVHGICSSMPQETLNLRMCKYTLGVHSKASNAGVLGDLGRYPLYIAVINNMVKYWHQLASTRTVSSPLVTAAYNVNHDLLYNMPDSWISSIKFTLTQLDLKPIYDSPSNFTTNHVLKVVNDKLKSMYNSTWKQSLQDDTCLVRVMVTNYAHLERLKTHSFMSRT
jgi:hypothetical protein